MLTGRARVSSKGWVVIPKEIREQMKLKPGEEVSFFYWPPFAGDGKDAGMLRLMRSGSAPNASLRGKYKGRVGGRPWTETLLEERRQELEREERRTERWAERGKKRKTSA